MVILQIKSTMLIFFILIKFCIISCQSNNDPQLPVLNPCYIGQWGNDYKTCPISSSLTQGNGTAAERQAQELKLVLNTDSTGYFNFYDCQNVKYYDGLIRFKYKVSNNQITFAWQGETEDIILASLNGFEYRSTYQIQCNGDSLIFPERMFTNNNRYHNTRYFLRR